MVLESYSLIPNVQGVVRSAYDPDGHASAAPNADVYANTASNMFHSYWAARERDLKPIIQHDLDAFRNEAKESKETASRTAHREKAGRRCVLSRLGRRAKAPS